MILEIIAQGQQINETTASTMWHILEELRDNWDENNRPEVCGWTVCDNGNHKIEQPALALLKNELETHDLRCGGGTADEVDAIDAIIDMIDETAKINGCLIIRAPQN